MSESAVTGFHHAAILAEDFDGAVAFYNALGLEVDFAWSMPRGTRAAFLAASDGTCMEIFEADAAGGPIAADRGPLLHVCLRTDDLDADYERIVEQGLQVSVEPENMTLEATTGQGPTLVRTCFFEGPTGEFVELLQGIPTATRRGVDSVASGFHHWAIATPDWDRTMRFCEDVLGTTVKFGWGAAPNRAIMLDTGNGTSIEVFERSGEPDPKGPLLHVCLRTSDVDGATDVATAQGAKIIGEPAGMTVETTSGHGAFPVRLSFVQGPTGEVIELLQGAG